MTYVKRKLFSIFRASYSAHGAIFCIGTHFCNRTRVGTHDIFHGNLCHVPSPLLDKEDATNTATAIKQEIYPMYINQNAYGGV